LVTVAALPPMESVEVGANASAPLLVEYRREFAVKDATPVPPPPTVRVPESEGVNVCVSPLPTIVSADVSPLKTEVEVASTWLTPVWS
jgi:hypothetical protein